MNKTPSNWLGVPVDTLDHAWWCTQSHVREVVRGGRVTLLCQDCQATDDDRS